MKDLIRPSGFYQTKAKGLQAVFEWHRVFDYSAGLVNKHFPEEEELRKELLSLHSVGPETADVLLLYVFDRVTFIADTYSRRLFTSLSGEVFKSYQALASRIDISQDFNLAEAQEFHGLIVEFGKVYLRKNQPKGENFLSGYRIIPED